MNDTKITRITGRAIPLRGSDIDTDRIIPARYLRCVTFDGLGEHAFEDDRAQDEGHPFNQPQYQGAKILLAGRNFGCGSSREHAPQSLNRWGIEGIIAESFAEIFYGNCANLGIPCFRLPPADLETLFRMVEEDPTLELTMDVPGATVKAGGGTMPADYPAGLRDALAGGKWHATMLLLEAKAEIEATARRLPYVSGW